MTERLIANGDDGASLRVALAISYDAADSRAIEATLDVFRLLAKQRPGPSFSMGEPDADVARSSVEP